MGFFPVVFKQARFQARHRRDCGCLSRILLHLHPDEPPFVLASLLFIYLFFLHLFICDKLRQPFLLIIGKHRVPSVLQGVIERM